VVFVGPSAIHATALRPPSGSCFTPDAAQMWSVIAPHLANSYEAFGFPLQARKPARQCRLSLLQVVVRECRLHRECRGNLAAGRLYVTFTIASRWHRPQPSSHSTLDQYNTPAG